jgi:hypothetical protein
LIWKEVIFMKSVLSTVVAGFFLLSVMSVPGAALAKKGGIGNGGGTRDGVYYHSHSDRSYSGKDQFKGKGNAYGRNKTKSKQGNAAKAQTGKAKGSKQKSR